MSSRFIQWTLICTAILASIRIPVAFGQTLPGQSDNSGANLGTTAIPTRGLHIYSASVYFGYMTSAIPLNGVALNYSDPLGGIGGDEAYGTDISVGWQYQGRRTNISAVYSGGYDGMVRYSNTNAFNHSLSINASRQLSPRWTVTASGEGMDDTMAEYLFQPSRLATITQAPTSFDDFSAAVGMGQFSSAQIASVLTGAPILESPARGLLLGDRVLSYTGQVGVSYSYSSRLAVSLSGFTAAGQNQQGSGPNGLGSYVMPRSTGLNAGAQVTYMLSPRTQVSVDASEYAIWNSFQRARGTYGTLALARKMGEHWFMRGYGGGALTQVSQQTLGTPNTREVIGGGALGVKTYSHTLAATYDRSSFDTYGFAVGLITTEMGSWNWQHPGSRWSTFASFGEEQMRDTGFASLSGWQASGGISLRMSDQTVLTAQYTHLISGGTYAGTFNQFTVDSIRVSLNWVPFSIFR